MFEFKHKCNVSDAEYRDFAALIASDNSHTVLVCEKCNEKLILEGTGAFQNARPQLTSIPGFVTVGAKP